MKIPKNFSSEHGTPKDQGGVSLIEMMVGIVIALIAVLVIFQVFSVSERYKRATTATGDAQSTGLFATFSLAREITNAGNGLTVSSSELGACPPGTPLNTLRPLPVVITDGGIASDSLVVFYGTPTKLVTAAQVKTPVAAGASFEVLSPHGIQTNDLVILAGGGTCAASSVSAISPPPADATGHRTVTLTPPLAVGFLSPPTLINLGQSGPGGQKIRYSLNNGTLYSESINVITGVAGIPNPLASNIVKFKAQYGIDNSLPPDGFLDTWVPAKDAPWDSATLIGASYPTVISAIKAVRIGLIVQSDEQLHPEDPAYLDPFNWVLFDCPDTVKANCPGRLASPGDGAALPSGFRYRIYETEIPLRNLIWNRS